MNASNDFFIRTTDPQHEAFVQGFVEKLRAAGDIEKRTYGGLYCTACEGFYYERDLVEGNCPVHGTEPVWLEEENYYFLLSRYQDRLREFYLAHPDWVRPRSRYNEALSFIESGLDDISISRKSITWGIPVPWDPEQVIYVWVDALINYVSALTYARPGDDLEARYWPADIHLLAKDILKFHAVIWPALLWSAGYEAPRGEFIHGYLLMGGEKMSKTRGNVLDPFAVIEQRGVDALRFYLFREVTFGQDGVISPRGLRAALQQRAGQRARQPRQPRRVDGRQVSRRPPVAGRRAGRRARSRRRQRRREPAPVRARPWSPPPLSGSVPSRSRPRSRRCGSSCAG